MVVAAHGHFRGAPNQVYLSRRNLTPHVLKNPVLLDAWISDVTRIKSLRDSRAGVAAIVNGRSKS